MKLWDIIKSVGSGVIREVVPGGNLILGEINKFLPVDKKLPATATGADINDAISSLPPNERAEVLGKEFDVDITQIKESNATLRTMLESDTKNPHTTRPYIAKQSFHIVAAISLIVVSLWAYGVGTAEAKLVKAVMDGWPFVLAVIGPFITLLWAYFGILKQEHKNKLHAANGLPSNGIGGAILNLIKNKKG